MFSDFLTNFLAGFALFFLGYSFEHIKRWRATYQIRNLWKPYLKSKQVLVVLSTRPGPHLRSTPRVSLNEMKGFVRISNTLKSFNIQVVPVDSQARIEDVVGHDVIVLGGPIANNISAEIWKRISANVPISIDLDKQSIKISEREYLPVEGVDGKLEKDYGLIIRLPNPFDETRNMFLFLGCHGYATYGTVVMLTDKILSSDLSNKVTGAKNFVVLTEFRFQNNTLSSAKVIESYILSNN